MHGSQSDRFGDAFEIALRHGSLDERDPDPGQQLLQLERFPTPVALDDGRLELSQALIGGEAVFAARALAAAPNRAVLRGP